MRTAALFALTTLALVACSGGTNFGASEGGAASDAGGAQPSGDDGGGSSGSLADTGAGSPDGSTGTSDSGKRDAGKTAHPDTGTSDTGPTADTGPSDTGPGDTGKPDAGKDTGAPDTLVADVGPSDAPVVLGESCSSPIDVSAGGSFAIDTCSYTNSFSTSCGATAAAAILAGVSPLSGSTYSLTLPSGWVVQQLDSTCAPEAFECTSTGMWSVSGATLSPYWYWAILPASGTCGTATISVDRIM